MTIQIFELTIKMTVKDNKMSRSDYDHDSTADGISKKDIIAECSEQVIRHLEQLKER